MYLSLNLVRQYVMLPDISADEIAQALTMTTVEVDDIIDQAASLRDVVVGNVVEIVKHPDADRLWVCRVDIKTEILQIVCGGINLREDMLVAVAKIGSQVRWHGHGELVELKKTKIRGVESQGMIVAAEEIGLEQLFPMSQEAEILDCSDYELKVGQDLSEALSLNDTIFVIDNKSMTHRPDLWGLYGLARELSVIFEKPLKPIEQPSLPRVKDAMELTVEVKDSDACPRYSAIVLDNITVKESPWWLRRDLYSVGLHSVNNVVDVANYVMILLGQPLHTFDYKSILQRHIVVDTLERKAQFKTLDAITLSVPPQALMIKDDKKSIAIAGIIGSESSRIAEKTKAIVIESANFSASSIRRTAQTLGMRTEASSRFEKKLDPELTEHALRFAVGMLQEIDPEIVVASEMIDIRSTKVSVPKIQVSQDLINRRLGCILPSRLIKSILEKLHFDVHHRGDIYTISIPTFRSEDITIAEDIIEEIARVYGYGKIDPILPDITVSKPVVDTLRRLNRHLKNRLVNSFGYTEQQTYSFAQPEWTKILGYTRNQLELQNYTRKDQAFLRTSLLPNLVAKAVENLRWYDSFKFFELARTYKKDRGEYTITEGSDEFLPRQTYHITGIQFSSKDSAEQIYQSIKGMVHAVLSEINIAYMLIVQKTNHHSQYVYDIHAHKKHIGSFGLLKPDSLQYHFKHGHLVWWDMDFELLSKFADFGKVYREVNKYPAIVRDLAIIVDKKISWESIEKAVGNASPLMKRMELFDVFESPNLGAGKKSIAFSMTFRSEERTLETAEVDKVVKSITAILNIQFSATIR